VSSSADQASQVADQVLVAMLNGDARLVEAGSDLLGLLVSQAEEEDE
jgi:hypothetical protein